MQRLLKGESPWYFDQDQPMTFVLVSRADPTDIKTFEASTCFVFHLLNAYELDSNVEIVGSRYEQFPGSLNFGDSDDAKASDRAVPYRWSIDLDSGKVTEQVIEDIAAEFPRINDLYVGKHNRFGFFGIGDGDFFSGFRKYDLASGQRSEVSFGDGIFGGEGVFVPGGSNDEDGGWLLTFVYDTHRKSSELWVFDAQQFLPLPIARVLLPTRVPYGFHGTWIPEVALT
jgi:carotenoid cleavage dioxygenase